MRHLPGECKGSHPRDWRGQPLQEVIRAVLVRVADSRNVEGGMDEVVDGAAKVQHRLSQVDQLSRTLAEDVDANETPVVTPSQKLDHPLGGSGNGCSAVVLEPSDADFVVEALRLCLFFGFANHGALGN